MHRNQDETQLKKSLLNYIGIRNKVLGIGLYGFYRKIKGGRRCAMQRDVGCLISCETTPSHSVTSVWHAHQSISSPSDSWIPSSSSSLSGPISTGFGFGARLGFFWNRKVLPRSRVEPGSGFEWARRVVSVDACRNVTLCHACALLGHIFALNTFPCRNTLSIAIKLL